MYPAADAGLETGQVLGIRGYGRKRAAGKYAVRFRYERIDFYLYRTW